MRRQPCTRGIEGMHRLQQRRVLVGRGEEFDLQCRFHIEELYHKGDEKKRLLGLQPNLSFIPMSEARGVSKGIW